MDTINVAKCRAHLIQYIVFFNNIDLPFQVVFALYDLIENTWSLVPFWVDFKLVNPGQVSFYFLKTARTSFYFRNQNNLFYR